MLRENKAEREQMEMVCIEEMVPKDHILNIALQLNTCGRRS